MISLFSKKIFVKENIFNFILLVWIISIPMKNATYQISTVLMIVYTIGYIFLYKDFRYLFELLSKYKDLIYSFLFILFCMVISNLFNIVILNDAWETVGKYILRYAIVFFILIYFYSKRFFNLKLLSIFIFISISIELFYAIYESIFIHNVFETKLRLQSFTFHANNLGFFMGIGFIISLFILNKNFKIDIKNIFIILFLISYIYVILFTYSRATWVALFISCIVYFTLNYKNIERKYLIYLMIFIGLIFITVYNIDTLNLRLKLLFAGNSAGRTTHIWLPALELIKEKYLIGYGVGIETVKLHNKIIYSLGGFHNVTIEILFYTGILGLLAFSILLFLVIKEIFINKQWKLFIIIIFIFINSQFDQSIFLGKPYLSSLTIFLFFIFSKRIYNLK